LILFLLLILLLGPVDYMPEDWETHPGFTDTQIWPEFFHMPVLMLMLITLLNDGTLITIGYDNAKLYSSIHVCTLLHVHKHHYTCININTCKHHEKINTNHSPQGQRNPSRLEQKSVVHHFLSVGVCGFDLFAAFAWNFAGQLARRQFVYEMGYTYY